MACEHGLSAKHSKACWAAYIRASRKKRHGEFLAGRRAYYASHPEQRAKRSACSTRWANDPINAEKCRAHSAVYRATRRGQLARPAACEHCGAECRPQAHHPDYSKPLDVRWLCTLCHAAAHATPKPKG